MIIKTYDIKDYEDLQSKKSLMLAKKLHKVLLKTFPKAKIVLHSDCGNMFFNNITFHINYCSRKIWLYVFVGKTGTKHYSFEVLDRKKDYDLIFTTEEETLEYIKKLLKPIKKTKND